MNDMQHESCTHLLAELSAFLDGEASAEICDEIERHLSDCGDCRVVVGTLRKTVLLYRDLPQPSLSAEARERLYKQLNLAEFLVP
jgi:anti-sigma factor RsiW